MKNGNNKRTFYLLGVLVILILAWFYTKQSGVDIAQDASSEDLAVVETANVLLAKAQSIKFDFSILESKAFSSLINRDLPLLNLPVGRENPFAPAP